MLSAFLKILSPTAYAPRSTLRSRRFVIAVISAVVELSSPTRVSPTAQLGPVLSATLRIISVLPVF